MRDLKGKLAIDTSALIELIYCDGLGQKLKKALETDMVDAYTTELAITELRYILCRKLGWQQSSEKVNKLLASGYFTVEETSRLIDEAAKIKCKRAISLPDCFILALAHKISGVALFARQEQEVADEMQKKTIRHQFTFLRRGRIRKTEVNWWTGRDLNPVGFRPQSYGNDFSKKQFCFFIIGLMVRVRNRGGSLRSTR